MLTDGQIAHFDAFGFLFLQQLLTPEEVATMKRESTEIFDDDRGDTPFDGQKRQAVEPFFERRPFLNKPPGRRSYPLNSRITSGARLFAVRDRGQSTRR